jgi:hypothetical protein
MTFDGKRAYVSRQLQQFSKNRPSIDLQGLDEEDWADLAEAAIEAVEQPTETDLMPSCPNGCQPFDHLVVCRYADDRKRQWSTMRVDELRQMHDAGWRDEVLGELLRREANQQASSTGPATLDGCPPSPKAGSSQPSKTTSAGAAAKP